MRTVAREYESVARLLDSAVRNHLSGGAFDGTRVGRAYVEHGVAMRSALDNVVGSLPQWSRAADAIAVALQSSADWYRDADAAAAGRVG
ncbi:MAG: type VII secretion target [Mycolicibacterium sp.]